jgi:hypothetical protein
MQQQCRREWRRAEYEGCIRKDTEGKRKEVKKDEERWMLKREMRAKIKQIAEIKGKRDTDNFLRYLQILPKMVRRSTRLFPFTELAAIFGEIEQMEKRRM